MPLLKGDRAHVVRTLGIVLLGVLVGYGLGYLLPLRSRPVPTPAEPNIVAEILLQPTGSTESGGIYGEFALMARLVNNGKEDLRDLTVVAEQVHAIPGYAGVLPHTERKMQYIAILPAGRQVSLRFTGFQTFHPEERQEVVVNILGHPGLRKASYKAVFDPGSQD